jgi:hypothetical protein
LRNFFPAKAETFANFVRLILALPKFFAHF